MAVDSRCAPHFYRIGRLWRLDIFAIPTHRPSVGGGSSGADWNPGLAIHQSDWGSPFSGRAYLPGRGGAATARSDWSLEHVISMANFKDLESTSNTGD